MILSLTLNIALNKLCNVYNIVDVNNSSIEDIDHIIKICKKYNNTYSEMYYHVSDITLFITKLLSYMNGNKYYKEIYKMINVCPKIIDIVIHNLEYGYELLYKILVNCNNNVYMEEDSEELYTGHKMYANKKSSIISTMIDMISIKDDVEMYKIVIGQWRYTNDIFKNNLELYGSKNISDMYGFELFQDKESMVKRINMNKTNYTDEISNLKLEYEYEETIKLKKIISTLISNAIHNKNNLDKYLVYYCSKHEEFKTEMYNIISKRCDIKDIICNIIDFL